MSCSFCSNEAEKFFNHLTYDLGSLCIECYMKLHGSCGVCSHSLLPSEVMQDITYQVWAKFIGFGEKNLIVCDHCFEAVRKEFPQMFA